MINIEDYLEEFVSPEPLHSDHDAEIIDFHGEPSREEIGKWVDKVMGLHAESNVENYVNESTAETDDPCFQLADLFISNDLI